MLAQICHLTELSILRTDPFTTVYRWAHPHTSRTCFIGMNETTLINPVCYFVLTPFLTAPYLISKGRSSGHGFLHAIVKIISPRNTTLAYSLSVRMLKLRSRLFV
jgi:hypothetical protein